MRAEKISLDQAKSDKLFYFVASVVVYRVSDKRCLILKRDERERVHPGKYGVTGGKLEWGDLDLAHPTRMNGDVVDFQNAVDDLLKRETREEAGIEIADRLEYLNNVVFVRPDGIPVVLMKFAALYVSGEVVPEPGAFTDFAWVNEVEVQSYDCIDGVKEEVQQTIKIFNN